MIRKLTPLIRRLENRDVPEIVEAFRRLGWNKPSEQYERYLKEQELQFRDVYVAFVEGTYTGYLTICWRSSYEPFRADGIPEIVDFNVLPAFRRRAIGSRLMDHAENEIAKRSPVAGIGVGMTADYGAAQKLYVLRGYIPDGRGLQYKGQPVQHGETLTVDDSLVLYFTKRLRST